MKVKRIRIPAICSTCKSRTKHQSCRNLWHVSGHILTDICFECKDLQKYSACKNKQHLDGQPLEQRKGRIVMQLCQLCQSLEKREECYFGGHIQGRNVLGLDENDIISLDTSAADLLRDEETSNSYYCGGDDQYQANCNAANALISQLTASGLE